MAKTNLFEKYYVGEKIEQTQILNEKCHSKSCYIWNMFNGTGSLNRSFFQFLLKLFKIGSGSTIQIVENLISNTESYVFLSTNQLSTKALIATWLVQCWRSREVVNIIDGKKFANNSKQINFIQKISNIFLSRSKLIIFSDKGSKNQKFYSHGCII